MVDPAFGMNDFNEPKTYNESQTIANSILMLLFGRPGFYPSIPTLGIAIQDYIYQFFDDIDTDQLKAKITYQCDYFLDTVRNGELEISKVVYNDMPFLLITIPITVEKAATRLAIGITTNSDGNMVFNFEYED